MSGALGHSSTASNAITRRGFLRVAGLTGGGLVAASVAACQVAATPGWSFGAAATPGAATPPPTTRVMTPTKCAGLSPSFFRLRITTHSAHAANPAQVSAINHPTSCCSSKRNDAAVCSISRAAAPSEVVSRSASMSWSAISSVPWSSSYEQRSARMFRVNWPCRAGWCGTVS
jgi:hypothetical protein